jgi:hypothetical protein
MSTRQYVYVSVGGDKFDPVDFQICNGGKVMTPRRGGHYWKSDEVPVEGQLGEIGEALLVLMKNLRPALIRVKDQPGITIGAQAVRYSAQCCGFNVPPELIQLLAEVGASIDFDQYHYPDEADAPPSVGEKGHAR